MYLSEWQFIITIPRININKNILRQVYYANKIMFIDRAIVNLYDGKDVWR